jgi:prepilin-type N-terminal cleavage/methylation domain-containing protein
MEAMADDNAVRRRCCEHLRCPVRSAFTLIELLIVIGIIGALLTIALPSLARLFASGADAQAYNLMAAQLVAVRAQALKRSRFIGLHVQMVDSTVNPSFTDVCYAAVLRYDDSSGNFVADPDTDLLPRRIPGNMAFAEVKSPYVNDAGDYQPLDNLALVGFTTFTVVFSPSGTVVRQVNGADIRLDTSGNGMFTGTNRLWDSNAAVTEPGATALAMFDYAKLSRGDWNDNNVNSEPADRQRYLDMNCRFLTINRYTGQLDRRR